MAKYIQAAATMSFRKPSADQYEGLGYNSNFGGLVKQMEDLALQPARPNHIPSPILCTEPTRNFRSMSFDSQPLVGMSNERSYLVENLRRQHARGERLSHALSNVETQLGSAQRKSEARKLRKEAGLLRSKITEARKQEELITMRLNDLQNEDLKCFYQAQQTNLCPYPYSPLQPWGQVQMPPLTPLTPISPLTPLPAGLFSPAPVPPSPLDSPYFFSPTFPAVDPYEQGPQIASLDQMISEAEYGNDGSSVELQDVRRYSLVVEPVRRWSLADAYSPSPKDKRMSMPGLKTIWRFS
ncbi:hypothetical protein KVR01_002178 [Diaporthe batatas]|uniref:uncharacterized protein n=1 Tax=Diaporthe batatas TaxID=748121 RepID=UPI001D05B2C3|nr:uncharacterized protein KVR01_002178 [Diaporthe batatas]KAG8166489.1 hypothetical protein KVR01_002178 [Diaporthe batatas]